jgi:PAS domain S-box-containing protein
MMMRVLVVDDKEENVYYLRALLGAHDCEVETARHGAEALTKARLRPPALVISDLLMPVMDGYTLLKHWKADEQLKRIPFVVYTATYTDPDDEQLALNLGADAFILKPAEPNAFVERVRAIQAHASSNPSVSARQPAADETGLLREYSETLIRKLEKKTLQLEETNKKLELDISARKLAETALRESEARFRQLAENIDEVFWLTDLDSRFIYVSPAYEVVWGRSREHIYADPGAWLADVHVEDREQILSSLTRYASGTWDETYRIVRPDGRDRWIRSRAYPVRDTGGEIFRVAAISRDITEYRLLEEKFRHAQKMEAIGRLAGSVAHDFNNLLSVILSYTSLALEHMKPQDPIRSDVEEVLRAGERATDLSRQLLAFSRQQILQPRVLDLGRVLADMEKMLRRLLGEDVVLSLVLSPSHSRVRVDPSQMEQVVMNLVVNARDAMPKGGTLTIQVADVELDSAYAAKHAGVVPGTYVMLAVTDTGIGMDPKTSERIFEPFFTTKDRGKGTGLGLSTVFGIVKQSLGHIEVRSELGAGTKFTIYLPSSNRAVEVATPRRAAPTNLRGSETILLVEDDDQVRAAAREILTRNGYSVLEAQNGGEALLVSEKFEAKIDVLITDVVMPRLGGRELADRLSRSRPGMRVLYVSGYADSATTDPRVVGLECAVLHKPTTPETLLRKVREVVGVPA